MGFGLHSIRWRKFISIWLQQYLPHGLDLAQVGRARHCDLQHHCLSHFPIKHLVFQDKASDIHDSNVDWNSLPHALDNPDLPIDFVRDLVIAKSEGKSLGLKENSSSHFPSGLLLSS